MSTKQQAKQKYTYGYWRTDKDKEQGFSHELISSDSELITSGGKTDLDTLEALAIPGVDTLFQALKHQVKIAPK